MQRVSVEEAKANLPELIEAVVSGEEVLIAKDDQPMAKLVSAESSQNRRQFGGAKGLITIHEDFDEPLEDFREYME